MKILISIQPEYVKKIIDKEKLLEIRKTMPKCELPIEVEIYCTKKKSRIVFIDENVYKNNKYSYTICHIGNGKVVAKFTLEEIDEFTIYDDGLIQGISQFELEDKSCLTWGQIACYIGYRRKGYAYHISNLQIYDKPKELKEFGLSRPPQSWCYINEE